MIPSACLNRQPLMVWNTSRTVKQTIIKGGEPHQVHTAGSGPYIPGVVSCLLRHGIDAMKRMTRDQLAAALEMLYERRNRRAYVNPDPLHCVYRFTGPEDQEIAGLIAAGLAYGRVTQIMRSLDAVFERMEPSPRRWLEAQSECNIESAFEGFQHRWTTGSELAALLVSVRGLTNRYGTLERAYLTHQRKTDETTIPALIGFCNELRGSGKNSLLPDPAKNAACKRLHLYLRWMVRCDAVDPGCWSSVDPARLVVPLDTHMHRIARQLGLTRRKQANLATALEITRAFRRIRPEDPIRYDFVLTRFGIRPERSLPQLAAELRQPA